MDTAPMPAGRRPLADHESWNGQVLQAILRGQDDLLHSFQRLKPHSSVLQQGGISRRLAQRLSRGPSEPLSPWLTLSYYRIGRHLEAG